MYSVGHNNIFIALMATSFGHNGHHKANVIQNLRRLVHELQKLSVCMGSHLHQSQYLLTALKCVIYIIYLHVTRLDNQINDKGKVKYNTIFNVIIHKNI
jgi:hypothetical protein